MLVAALRVPAPIPSSLPPPARPLLRRHRHRHRLPPAASMADAGATTNKPAPAPQPPEKPLPGDCCGSGCVRCVWDVYYDELDAYNKALAAHSSSAAASSGSSSSKPATTTTSDGAKS